VIDKLLNEKLLQELRAKDNNRPYSLRITKAGLRAIAVEDAAEASDNNTAADPDEIATGDVSPESKSNKRPSRAKRSGTKKTAAISAKTTKASSDRTKPDSKQDRIVALLQRWTSWSRRRNGRSIRYGDFSQARCARN
jgi:hypothetical protein